MKTIIKCAAWSSEKFIPGVKFLHSGINRGRAESGQKTNSKLVKSKPNKCADVRQLSTEAGCVVLNGRIHRPGEPLPNGIFKGAKFRAEEHLKVQQEIERLAHKLWCAQGCRQGGALGDWLRAEREVLEQFIAACVRRHLSSRCSRPGSLVGVARRKPENRILKHRR